MSVFFILYWCVRTPWSLSVWVLYGRITFFYWCVNCFWTPWDVIFRTLCLTDACECLLRFSIDVLELLHLSVWVELRFFLSSFFGSLYLFLLSLKEWRFCFFQEGENGGCRNHSTWLSNPQVTLKLAQESKVGVRLVFWSSLKSLQVVVILAVPDAKESVGFYILKVGKEEPWILISFSFFGFKNASG